MIYQMEVKVLVIFTHSSSSLPSMLSNPEFKSVLIYMYTVVSLWHSHFVLCKFQISVQMYAVYFSARLATLGSRLYKTMRQNS